MKKQTSKSSFVKLTRLDGSPIWLNASFVVTVEPRKGGGSVVVPIGDGLDYDVRETPEMVLAVLDGAPVPEVVPVPTTDALTPTPDDVSPESSAADLAAEGAADEAETPAKKPIRKTAAQNRVSASREFAAAVPTFEPLPQNKPEVELLDEELVRLRKMAPRTVKKLQNTLMTQFRGVNAEAAVTSLAARGYITIDGTRVNWLQPGEQIVAVTPTPAPAPVAEQPAPAAKPEVKTGKRKSKGRSKNEEDKQ